MSRCAPALLTAAGRIAMIRDVAIFCVAFCTMKRGFELSVVVASQVLQMAGGEGLIFNFCLERRCEVPPKRWWQGRIKTAAKFARSQPWSSTNRRWNPCNGHSPRGQRLCCQVC